LISKDPLENSLIIEALLEILSPIFNKCVFLNIPYLKAEMIDYIDSPVPFIIGVEEAVWNKLFMRKWPELQDDVVCFDLETELLNSKVDVPSPPEPMHTMI
jgi:hypothetical protein